MNDVMERAESWIKAANAAGILFTDKDGYLTVILDLIYEVQALRKVVTAVKALHDNAEEWECDGLGLWAQHGFWEDVFDALEELEDKNG